MEQGAKALPASKAKKDKKEKHKISYMNAVDSDDSIVNSTESDDYFCIPK